MTRGVRCPPWHIRETNRPSIRLRRPRSPTGSWEGDWGRKVKGKGEGWGRKTTPSCSTGPEGHRPRTRNRGQVAAPYRPLPRGRDNRHPIAPRVPTGIAREPGTRVKLPHPTDRCRAAPTNRHGARGGAGARSPRPRPPNAATAEGAGEAGGMARGKAVRGIARGTGAGGTRGAARATGGANARTHRRDEDGLPNAPDGRRPRPGRAPRARRSVA